MSDVAGVKERVQAFLTEDGPAQIDRDGDFVIGAGSTQVFIRVLPHPNEQATLVNVMAPVLRKVPVTAELYKYVATHSDNLWFGHLAMYVDENEEFANIVLTHTLLGDYLDKDELFYAAYGIAGSADEADDMLKELFGGERLIEE